MRNSVTSPSPLSGSIPMKLFSEIAKKVTASIARMPPSGSNPVKLFMLITKRVTASITRMPPSGSAPSKRLK
eukprot:574916-Amphidinium_carterae.1